MADSDPRSAPSDPRQRARPGQPSARRERPRARSGGAPAAAAQAAGSARTWRAIPAPLRWIGAILFLIAVAVAIFVEVFQWNWLRGPIDNYLSARMNRPVVIHGDLTAKIWSWTPSVTAREVTVAEPPWAGKGPMATLPSLTVALDLKAYLFHGKFILAEVDAEHPSATLLRNALGRNNWTFGPLNATPQPLRLPPVRHFTINGGRVVLNDARRKLYFTGEVSSNEQVTGFGRGRFSLIGQGEMNRAPFRAQVSGGPLINVDPNVPYPFHTDIWAGSTHIVATGDIRRPFDLGVMQATGRVTGEDMASLYRLTGLALPNTPPYDLSGHVARNDTRYDITGLHGHIGQTDLAGHIMVNRTGERRDLTGDLFSRRLNLADLTAVVGGAPPALIKGQALSPLQKTMAAKLSAQGRILPDARLDVTRLRDNDADLRYRAESVAAGPLPIRHAFIHARLDRGLLTIDPLTMTLPQGALSGSVRLDARSRVPATSLRLSLARARAQELLPTTPKIKGPAPFVGPLAASARLFGVGDSVRSTAATANGVVAVAMPSGQMRQMLAEALGIDVGRTLFMYLSKDDKPTQVHCAVAVFRARNGVLQAQNLAIDTDAMLASGKGVVDLRNETVNLSLSGKPKHFRLLRLAAPITLKGRLAAPKLGVDIAKALPQAGAAAALGALVSPLAAVLPFVDLGTAKNADCPALIAQARSDGVVLARQDRRGAQAGH
jgi:uncharacterized protein involved in outer membrane biogenesis